MSSTLNLKKKKLRFKKEVIVIISAIILTTAAIKASDNFFNSNEAEISGNEKCPPEMIFLPSDSGGFCIDKYEAAPGPGCPYPNPNNQLETRSNIDAPECFPAIAAGAIPWRNISQNQAALTCAKAGKRLPTNKEWLAASRGTPDLASGWSRDDCQVAKNWETQPGPSGSGQKCVSSFGVYDMVGNVWEWVEGTIYDGVYAGRDLPEQGYIAGIDEDALPSAVNPVEPDENYYHDYLWIKKKGTRAFARGGYWDNKSEAGQYSIYLVSPPSFVGIGIGFRCAK